MDNGLSEDEQVLYNALDYVKTDALVTIDHQKDLARELNVSLDEMGYKIVRK